VRTAEQFGRWGSVRGRRWQGRLLSTYERARKQLARLSVSLDAEIDRLGAAIDLEDQKRRSRELSDLVRTYQKALTIVLDCEAKLERRAELSRPGKDLIDLDEARAEIARRLARLAERG